MSATSIHSLLLSLKKNRPCDLDIT